MKYTCKDLIRRVEQGDELELILFWGHTAKPGKITKACLSQWYPCRFVAEGVEYCCTEQYMMAQKAILFGDGETCAKIMASDDPGDIKALGREIRGFEQRLWDERKYQIVLAGNIAKFSQNEQLKAYLLETGDAALVEASPYDGIWGVCLAADDPLAQDPHTWRGENLLGFALMEARDIIRDAAQGE